MKRSPVPEDDNLKRSRVDAPEAQDFLGPSTKLTSFSNADREASLESLSRLVEEARASPVRKSLASVLHAALAVSASPKAEMAPSLAIAAAFLSGMPPTRWYFSNCDGLNLTALETQEMPRPAGHPWRVAWHAG